MANIKAVSGYRNLEAEIRNVLDFINRMKGGNSVTFKDGVIDTLEPCNPDGVPNFAGLKLGKVGQNKFNLTVENKFTFANENYIEGYDGRGFFLGFDDFDNYTSSLLEVDNVTIRGSLLARQFIIDTWKYRAGNTIQGAGGAVVSDTDGSTWATFVDPLGNSGEFFIADDVVMCQEVDRKGVTYDGNGDVVDDSYLIKRLIFKVDSVVSGVVTFTSVTGAPGNKATISKGDEFVILYNESDSTRGNIIGYMTNVSDGPYIYMKEGITDWAGWSANNNVSLVLGNLDFFSVTDFPAMTGFGLYAENVYLTGHISLTDNGYINLGKTAYNDTVNSGLWIGDKDSGAGIDPYIYFGSAGDVQYLKIDTDAGTFDAYGFEISAGAVKSSTTMTYARGATGVEDGYWLGEAAILDYRFFVGNSFVYLKWDSSVLSVFGGDIASSVFKSSTTMTYDRGIAGTEGGLWVGKYGTGDYRLFIGSSATKYLAYDNTDLTMVGGTITGGTIQTATSGQRVVLASNVITFYNSSGTNVGTLYGSDYAGYTNYIISNANFILNSGKVFTLGLGAYISANTIPSGLTITPVGTGSDTYWEMDGNILVKTFLYLGDNALDTYLYRVSAGVIGCNAIDSNSYVDAATGFKVNGTEIVSSTRSISNIVNITNSGYVDSGSYIDAASGFRVNGSATSGYFLRGNGTNCVLSTIQETDIHALAMTWIQTHDWGGRCSIAASDGDINTDGLIDAALYINADDGFKYNGGAASGYYLRGNGTYFVSSAIQSGDLPSHTHSASNITSGTLDIARGGTGASSWTANRVVVVNSVGSALTSSSITTTHIGALGTGLSATKVWSTTYNDHTVVILYGAIQSWTIT